MKFIYPFLLFVFFLNTSLFAQNFTYVDNPDTTYVAQQNSGNWDFYIDINQDGVDDFKFYLLCYANSFGGASKADIVPLDSNLVLTDSINTGLVAKLNHGDSISQGSTFDNASSLLYHKSVGSTPGIGHWTNDDSISYCGLRFYSPTDGWQYCWMRIKVLIYGGFECQVTLYEYAYGPDPFRAGDGSLFNNIDKISYSENEYSLYPVPANNTITLLRKNRTYDDNDLYRIINIQGKVVLTGQITGNQNQISIQNLPVGFYFLQVGEGYIVPFAIQR